MKIVTDKSKMAKFKLAVEPKGSERREHRRYELGGQTLSVNRVGDLAMLHGKWIVHEAGPDHRQARREGRNTETARRQSDGRWLFVIDDPGAPGTDA